MIGELRETAKGWAVQAPSECINGHTLGPGNVLVGHNQCSCGGHLGWTCRQCGETIYHPPTIPECSLPQPVVVGLGDRYAGDVGRHGQSG